MNGQLVNGGVEAFRATGDAKVPGPDIAKQIRLAFETGAGPSAGRRRDRKGRRTT